MIDCRHKGWVARDIQGENRFLCKECDERFVRHPRAPRKSDIFLGALEHVKDFRNGLATFTEACEAASISAKDFKDALTEAFPPVDTYEEIATIGSLVTQRVVTGREPQRTSDPEDIEDNLFPTLGSSTSELLESWREAWPDIRAMEIHPFEGSRDHMTMVILTFIDESKQRLKFSECEIQANANPLVGSKSPMRSFTHPIIRQNYPQNIVDVFGTKDAF